MFGITVTTMQVTSKVTGWITTQCHTEDEESIVWELFCQ